MSIGFRPQNSIALVIGVGARFDADKLMEQSIEDARIVSSELSRVCLIPDDRIRTLYGKEASFEGIIGELDRITREILENPIDIFFFYFSGHGAVKDGNYYLVCNDNDGKDLSNGTIDSGLLVKKLQDINALKMVVLLDCCHAEGMTASGDNPVGNETLLLKRPDRVVLSASHYEQISFLSKPVSVFTFALLEGLGGKYLTGTEKDITIFDLALYVREKVSALSRQKQKPQFNVMQNNLTSNFVIAHFPEGKPSAPVFNTAFQLTTLDGKNIKMDNVEDNAVTEDEFINENNWIKTNTISVDGTEFIISVTGDIRSIHVNLLNIDSLISRIDEAEELKKDIAAESDPSRKKQKSVRLERITKEINANKENILSLARTFGRIELSTERLKTAYEEFLKGNPDIVDKILDLASLESEQKQILESAEIIEEQKKTSDERRILNANEFLLKASNTLLLDGISDRYKKAEELFTSSIVSYRNTVNLFAFGSFLLNQKRFMESAELFSECINIYSNAPGNRSRFRSDVASAYQNLAYCLEQLNEAELAGKCYESSLLILEQMQEEGLNVEEDLSSAYNNIANLKMAVMDFPGAETYLLKSLNLKKKMSESKEPANMLALSVGFLNLGKYYSDKGELINAYNISGSALSIIDDLRTKYPGKYDADYARAVNNIAQYLSNMDQPEVAAEAFEDCLKIRKTLYGRNPAGFAAELSCTLNGYGLLEYKQRNFGKAEELLKQALDIRRELALDHPESFEDEFAESLENYAMLVLNTNGAEAAEQYMKDAENIIDKLNSKMPRVFGLRSAQLKFHRALMQYVSENIDAAEKMCRQALAITADYPDVGRAATLNESISKFLVALKNDASDQI